MKIMDFLNEKAIDVNLQSADKEGVMDELLELLVKAGTIKPKDKKGLFKVLMDREALGSTGIGQGIGIPHGKSNCVDKLVGAFGISPNGVDFDSLDGEPAHLFFLLITPEDSAGPHLKALARISRLLKNKFFREALVKAKSKKEAIDIISGEDRRLH